MAKAKFELATLSKANKDLALLIDEDLQKESELLQKLIKEVYDAHQKVKDSHIRRVQETQDKLTILNAEIDYLKHDIDKQSHTITLEQFNTLLVAKDQIFEALHQMRLFDHDFLYKNPLKTHLSLFQTAIQNRLETIKDSASNTVSSYYKPVVSAIMQWVEMTLKQTSKHHPSMFDDSTFLSQWIEEFHLNTASLNTMFDDLLKDISQTFGERMHIFYSDEDIDKVSENMEKIYNNSVIHLQNKMANTTETFKKKHQALEEQLVSLEEDTLNHLLQKNDKKLKAEVSLQTNLQDDFKRLRFDIMHAEKQNDEKKLKTLLNTFNKLEKQNLSLQEEKVKSQAQKTTKAQRQKLLKQQKSLELNHQVTLIKLQYQLDSEKLKFAESRALFKMREDQKAFENDKKINQTLNASIKQLYQFLTSTKQWLLSLSETIGTYQIEQVTSIMTIKSERIEALEGLYEEFKTQELQIAKILRLNAFNQDVFKIHLDHEIEIVTTHVTHQESLQSLLREYTALTKQSEVDALRAQEDTKNELIYQHALVEIAQKEHELQLMKIKSLYDSEIDLTKSQAERLNIGIGVNESMVKTTVESQIHFAKQQIKFAEKEFEARLENIERTRQQELSYVTHKLAQAKQKYLFEEKTLKEERDQKLEDLSYRLALFTDIHDHQALKEQEQSIRHSYEEKLQTINTTMQQDTEIVRTNKQIESIEQRSEKAIEDAEALKDKTIETFESLLTQGEEKLATFTNKSEKTLIPYIETEAASTAQNRLEDALSEAKMELESKIKDPKARIDQLTATINEFTSQDNQKEQTLQDAIDKSMATHQIALSDLQTKKEAKLKTVESKRDAFIKRFSDDQLTSKMNILKDHYPSQHNKITEQRRHSAHQLQHTLGQYKRKQADEMSKQLNSVNERFKTITQHLEHAVKAYKKYLKTPWFSQSDRQKALKQAMREQIKVAKTNIAQKY